MYRYRISAEKFPDQSIKVVTVYKFVKNKYEFLYKPLNGLYVAWQLFVRYHAITNVHNHPDQHNSLSVTYLTKGTLIYMYAGLSTKPL